MPRSGPMESRMRARPLQRMKAPTTAPAQPSRSKPVKLEMTADMRTAPVVMTSFRESIAVALRVSDEMRRPISLLKAIIHSLTTIDAMSTTTTAGPKVVGSGFAILPIDDMMRFIPMAASSTDTVRPARYSKRPCPKGWWLSAGLLAGLKPSMLTMLLEASERLLTASATIEMDPTATPTMALPTQSRTLHTMHTMPANCPYRVRTAGSDVLSASLTKILTSQSDIVASLQTVTCDGLQNELKCTRFAGVRRLWEERGRDGARPSDAYLTKLVFPHRIRWNGCLRLRLCMRGA